MSLEIDKDESEERLWEKSAQWVRRAKWHRGFSLATTYTMVTKSACHKTQICVIIFDESFSYVKKESIKVFLQSHISLVGEDIISAHLMFL